MITLGTSKTAERACLTQESPIVFVQGGGGSSRHSAGREAGTIPLIGPCCHGKTEEEVLPQLITIVAEWIDIYKEDGLPLPRSAVGEYSGKFLLRTGKELHRFLAIRALQSGDSLNNFIVKKLRASSPEDALDTPKQGKKESWKSFAHP